MIMAAFLLYEIYNVHECCGGGVDPIPCVSTHRISDPRSGPAQLLPPHVKQRNHPTGSTNVVIMIVVENKVFEPLVVRMSTGTLRSAHVRQIWILITFMLQYLGAKVHGSYFSLEGCYSYRRCNDKSIFIPVLGNQIMYWLGSAW